jgi:hypothetical protein
MPKRPYPAWRRRHDAVLLYVTEHPFAKLRDVAAACGYTPSQVSRIMCSPDFEIRYEDLVHNAVAEARYRQLMSMRSNVT